jgi:hypothetical protein
MIRNIKYTIFISVGLILFLLVSCNNWLDLEPENQLVKQEFWQSKEDVEAVVASMYDAYRECARDLWIWGELRADMVEIVSNDLGGFRSIADGDILPSNGVINWSKFYNAINLANTLKEFSDDVLPLDETFTIEVQKAYEAEALFIRAKSYFDLLRIWKEVPLVTIASSADTVSFAVEKNSEAEIIKQIEIDLLQAKTTAFTDEFKGSPDLYKGRVNAYAVNALLADVYLWSEQYEKCIEVCDEIINSGRFALMSSETWFELYCPGNAPESIFEIQFNDALEDEQSSMNTSLFPVIGGKRVGLKPYAEDLFDETDIRQGDPDPSSKYTYKSLSPKTKRKSSERDANVIYYRYADVLLMKAEALAELGQFSESNFYINEILQRAMLPTLSLEANILSFRNAILEQRAKEFAFEGKRWFDVLRFAKRNNFENKQLIVQMILAGADVKQRPILRSKILDTMSYYLPIPKGELEHNPNLVQNPFYDR